MDEFLGRGRALAAFLGLLAACATVSGQSAGGSLAGTVLDPAGLVVPDTEVATRNIETGIVFRTRTDESGRFVVPVLPVGRYELSVDHDALGIGETIVSVGVGMSAQVDLQLFLKIAPPDVVVVRADASRRGDPGSSAVESSVRREAVERLPLNQREFFRLALLAEGVQPPAPGSELSRQNESGLNVFGAREAANNYLLDGVDNNDAYINRLVVSPPLDSIREFRLHSTNYKAEYGRSGGAQVNVVSRSGTNQLHASFYEYFRNDALDARNFFDPSGQPKPKFQRNQFGASLGGPVRRDKSFVFMGFEGTRVKDAVTRTSRVPTPQELAGDFSASPGRIFDPFTQAPFPNNVIPTDRVDPISRELGRAWPTPNRADPVQNLATTPVGDGLWNQVYGRADWYATEADALYFRYNFGHNRKLDPFGDGDTAVPGFGSFTVDRGQNLVLSETHVFGPRTVVEARFGYNRLERDVQQQNAGNDIAGQLGIRGLSSDPRFTGFPAVNVAGVDSIGDETALPIVRDDQTLHFLANLTTVRGAHVVKFGAEGRRVSIDGIQGLFGRGQLNFLGAIAQNPTADFVLGLPTFTIRTTIDNPFQQRMYSLSGFAQDDWRATPRLTLNVGLRYEYNQPAYDAEDRFALYDFGSNSLISPAASALGRAGYAADRNNFAPRVGAAYRAGDQWVLRAGYGVFYDLAVLEANSGLYFNPPYFDLRVFAPSETRLLTLADPFPTGAGFAPMASVNAIDPNFRTGYAQHWNGGVERTLPGGILLRASYVGTKGVKLLRRRDLNQPAPGPGDVDARRPIPGFANVVVFESAAGSVYHGGTLRLERRFSSGPTFSGAWTVSKSIDGSSAFLDSDGDQGFPQNSHDFAAERGLSSFDQRNRFVATADYALPIRGAILGGWRLLAIASFGSGRPLTPALSSDNSNTGNGGGIFGQDRPNLVGPANDGPKTPEEFFSTAAFEMPAPQSFGTAGRNVLIGPGFRSVDLAVTRELAFGERLRMEIRGEAFNVMNSANFELPRRFADQPTFGRITAARPARQLQLGLRLTY